MKNRDYKEFAPMEFYHVFNRGVGKMDIFLDKEDFNFFLYHLREGVFPELAELSKKSKSENRRKLLPPKSFNLISYCLMPNHFHLLIEQLTELPITKLISKVCTSYSIYYNKKYQRVGSVFQDTFKSVRVSRNEQLIWASVYIHDNPTKARLVNDIREYKWSSFSEYLGESSNPICNKDSILNQYQSATSYLNYFFDKFEKKKAEEAIIGFGDLFIDY